MRVDPQDNIWVVDQFTSMVIKFDPNGREQMLLGRKNESERVPALPLNAPPGRGGRGADGAGAQSDIFVRPTDVAWDAAGNIYVADGMSTNARVAKFDKNGVFIKSWGSKGTAEGQFNFVHGIALDAQGNVYVADSNNRRIQVFDGDGNFKTAISNIGRPAAICISPGPRQFIYSSNSNAPNNIDENGDIYKIALDGQVVGKFGRAVSCRKSSARSMPSTAVATTSYQSANRATGASRRSLYINDDVRLTAGLYPPRAARRPRLMRL